MRHYVGCDISDVALAHAGRNLASLGCPLQLNQVDLTEGIAAGNDKFDVVFSSFALHHLTTAGKAGFFEHARRRLAPNGALLLIDVAREENEDRNTYMDAYCGWIKSGWNKLSQADLDFIFDHIRNNDFPETDAELRRMALNAGFQNGTLLKAELWHHLWEFA